MNLYFLQSLFGSESGHLEANYLVAGAEDPVDEGLDDEESGEEGHVVEMNLVLDTVHIPHHMLENDGCEGDVEERQTDIGPTENSKGCSQKHIDHEGSSCRKDNHLTTIMSEVIGEEREDVGNDQRRQTEQRLRVEVVVRESVAGQKTLKINVLKEEKEIEALTEQATG